jgi:hypothetical protein
MFNTFSRTLFVLAAFSTAPAYAVDSDAVIGGAIGGGLGAAVGSEVGGREGAIAGSAIGAAIGTAVAADDRDSHEGAIQVETHSDYSRPAGPPPHAYRTPPGHAKHNRQHKWK